MPPEELTLILRLRDEATKQMKSARAGIVAAGAAIAAAGFTAGKKWDQATKTIVAGTGATGKALKGLQSDYQAVAKYGDGAATVIADLNTHLGLEGDALRMVAEAALKAKVDTNLFGDVASQLGLDAEGAAGFLDQLTVAAQGSGVDIDVLTRTIGRSGARWQEAGGSMDDLAATVVKAAYEFGPSGLRGKMSEVLQEVDKGLIPAVESLTEIVGESTEAVNKTFAAGHTWRDTLREMKDGALAYLGPAGDMVGAIGSAASGLALAGPQMVTWIKGMKLATIAQRAFNLAMRLNPIGLVITALVLAGVTIWKFRDQIMGFLSGAWNKLKGAMEAAKAWLSPLIGLFGDTSKEVANLSDELAGHSLTTALDEVSGRVDILGGDLKAVTNSTHIWRDSINEAGNVLINQFIPGPLRGLTGGISAAFSSIMGKGGEGGKGGLMGAFKAFTGAIGPAGFIALGAQLLIKHFDKVIAGLKKIIGWVKKAFGWFLRLFGIGKKKKKPDLNLAMGVGSNTSGTSASRSGPGSNKRHRGGPVTAGQSYSTIPGEVFVPSTNGTVINPGIIDYDRLGSAVAAAMRGAPLVVPQDPVTDALYRNGPRRAALKGYA